MLRSVNIVFIFLIFILTTSFSHKYYHSYTVIRTTTTSGSAEAEVEIIWHDLEQSLSKDAGKTVTIKSADFSKTLENYFSKNFQLIQSDGQKINLVFVGYEINSDDINIFIEFPNVRDFTGMRLKNALLVKEFPEQINQVTIKQGKLKKSFVFNSKSIEKIL